jgi:hypothetical protein
MAPTDVAATKSKREKIASIIQALQAKGDRLKDEDLQQMQLKTDALLEADSDEDHDHSHPSPPPPPIEF